MRIDRRSAVKGAALAAAAATSRASAAAAATERPDIVIILFDDMGWGDLGVYGGRIPTPNLDRLAARGLRFTDAYAASSLCSPSRAAILTGRYPVRSGLAVDVVCSTCTYGLPHSEPNLGLAMRAAGYRTGYFGKWHLGSTAPYWPPTRYGFDRFAGLPYSHDMRNAWWSEANPRTHEERRSAFEDGLLSRRITDAAIAHIEAADSRPTFSFVAHTAPHTPFTPSAEWAGRSPTGGSYGDVVAEVDHEVGRLLDRIDARRHARPTLVIVTSDNGASPFGGSNGPYRDRKGQGGWEGGYRVPLIVAMPGRLPAGAVRNQMSMGFDVPMTVLDYAGARFAGEPVLDGRSLRAVLERDAPSPHDHLFYFMNEKVAGVRQGKWKYVTRQWWRSYDYGMTRFEPQLFDLEMDPGENYPVGTRHPEVTARLAALVAQAKSTFEALPQLDRPPT